MRIKHQWSHNLKKFLHKWWLVPLAYFVIAVAFTWPLGVRLTTHLPDGTDSLLHYWNSWWTWQAFKAGQLPYDTSYLFYPNGLSMVYHNFAWVHSLMWIGLRPFFGNIAAYNLTFLINLALCGIIAFWLVRGLLQNERAAFLAGVVYMAWPYRLTQPSHPNMMSTWAIPIFLLFLYRVVEKKRWQDGAWAGVALALVGYMRWQILIPAGLMGGIFLLLTLYNRLSWAHVRILVVTGVVTAVLLLPPILLLANEWQKNPAELVLEGEDLAMQTDVLAYGTPPGSHFLLSSLTQPIYEQFYADRGSRSSFSPYIGYVVLLLVVIGVWKNGRFSLPWAGMALMLIFLALGPTLRMNGQQYTSIPMPYNLLDAVIPIRLLREPDRFNMFIALPIAVLAGLGMRQLLSWVSKDNKWQPVLLIGVGVVLIFEYLTIPLPTQSAAVSDFYAQIAVEPGEFAVLNIPVDPFASKPSMFAQTVHGHPILQGHASRYPQNAFAYLEEQPWLRDMQLFSDIPPKRKNIGRNLARLAADGIRYVVIHKDEVAADQIDYWKEYFVIQPVFEDEAIIAYKTTPQLGEDYAFAAELFSGFGVIRAGSTNSCVNPGDSLQIDLAWGTNQALNEDVHLMFALVGADGDPQMSLRKRFKAADWGANTIRWDYAVMPLPNTMPEGNYGVQVYVMHPENGAAITGAEWVLGVDVQDEPCEFGLEGVTAVNAKFGNDIRLLGYEVEQDIDELLLTLHWQTLQRMDKDYKVFVHLFDPATGIPAAQDDAMPRRWQYPTSFWKPGEIVDDAIPIEVSDLPPGNYGIGVGVYDAGTGERLAVVDNEGRAVENGRLIVIPALTIR